jgi:hypothetical protein
MSLANTPVWTGGCQCGAVRFRAEGALGRASVCHCRMCQKATGNFYAPFAQVGDARLTWTRGALKHFASSNDARRGFCGNCGTPLTFEASDGVALAIGSFDEAEAIAPVIAWGVEAKLPYVDDVPGLPAHRTEDDPDLQGILPSLVSYQHPDHDTETWQPRPGTEEKP